MVKKRIQRLFVIFDTNVLFTQVASDLIRNDTQRIIDGNSGHVDLEIEWCLPEVVIGERKYQMLGKANELLPNMQKLERLLGHKFGVGEDTLELHVDKAISNSIEKHKLRKIGINTNEIDWNDLIERSVKRLPPFESTEKEKGFRDAIIAHSFLQLHKASPLTPNICRLVLVSEDQRLREYVAELTQGSNNVRILKGLDELESLINTLVSTVPESFAEELTRKASKVFFEQGNEKTFYYKESIGEKISEQCSSELKNTILSGRMRTNGNRWISEPIFIKKDRQQIHWMTPVEIEFEIYHFEKDGDGQSALAGLADLFAVQSKGLSTTTETPPSQMAQRGLGLLSGAWSQKKVVDLKGRDKFEIRWNTTLSQAQNLTSPKLLKIEYVGNNLPEQGS